MDFIAEELETANSFGALQYDNVTVPLVTPSDAPEMVTFDRRPHEVCGPDGRRMVGSYVPRIAVSSTATIGAGARGPAHGRTGGCDAVTGHLLAPAGQTDGRGRTGGVWQGGRR